jgi:acyl-CoA synthetase (AMP-forming)/AMP-acid ligase II
LDNDERSYLRTGDLGYIDEGSLYIRGRLKDIIIIRGRNYYPHDLEHTIHHCHPDLRINCCAVFSLEENDQELLIVVQEVKTESKTLNPEEIVIKIRSQILKEPGIEADVVVLAGRKAVPKTTSGKIQRVLCKKRYLEGTLNTVLIDKTPSQTAKSLLSEENAKRIFEAHPTDIAQILAPIFNINIHIL